MRSLAWALVAIVLVTRPAAAQAWHATEVAWFAAAEADTATTAINFSTSLNGQVGLPAREHDPLVAWVGPTSGPRVVSALIVTDVLTVIVMRTWVAPKHPKLAAWIYAGLAGVRTATAVGNVRAYDAVRK